MVRRIKRKEIFALLLCLLIGFALRFYTFDKKSLWVDEVHTFNDSRDNLKAQINFYKNNPTYLHPPLFFILTHFFYPFTKPERDLRIIPLIFGALSIPMIYLLAKQFSASIAIPCTLSLTFMTYHISLSQDGRPYPLLMFVGMGGVYFFMKHLSTAKRLYLVWAACSFATLFYISYQAILSIIFYQILWFYQVDEKKEGCTLSSIVIFNGTLFLLCLPWLLFIVLSYKGQPMMDPLHTEAIGSFWHILYWMLNDWVGNFPLVIASAVLLILPLLLGFRKNRIILLTILILPVASLYLFCKLFNFTHFFASRYFINFLPLMFISIYLSLHAIENKFARFKNIVRLKTLFVVLLVASNLMILPLYYHSEKQDFKGLVNYLKGHLLDGDNIFVRTKAYLPGILFYFGANPGGRHYPIIASKEPEKGMEYRIVSTDQGRVVRIFNSKSCCAQYLSEGNRLWIVVDKWSAKALKIDSPCVLKGFFDGSFANFRKFPSDASMYLFLWDPKSAEGKGINSAIE